MLGFGGHKWTQCGGNPPHLDSFVPEIRQLGSAEEYTVAVMEAKMTGRKERREERSGSTVECLDAPAGQVKSGSVTAAVYSSADP